MFRAVAHDAADLAHSYLHAAAREERTQPPPSRASLSEYACGQHGSAQESFFLGANEGNRAQEKNQGRALSRMASKRRRRTEGEAVPTTRGDESSS